jgi:hypothetical protein
MRVLLIALLGLALAVSTVMAIYPDDHWQYATKLTKSNYQAFVADNLKAGKTVVVRTIASSG